MTATGRSERVAGEIATYTGCEEVHDLPPIAHYWSNRYLVPMIQTLGFPNVTDMFRHYIRTAIHNAPDRCAILSVGAGAGSTELALVRSLLDEGLRNFRFECLDINPDSLQRGARRSAELGVQDWISFREFDVNSWNPERGYRVVLAIQSLHHFVELEALFRKIRHALNPRGYFLVDDMIGRNGHRRWPEALRITRQLWAELPEKYKHNHGTGLVEHEFENADASVIGFEGIRAQDILPLLLMNFRFEIFLGFANLIDPFIDRGFGPNFDPNSTWDRTFIDRVHSLDMQYLEAGTLKPTHLYAVMGLNTDAQTRVFKHLTPEASVRWPLRRWNWRARHWLGE